MNDHYPVTSIGGSKKSTMLESVNDLDGTLRLTVGHGWLVKSTNFWMKMDPYVVVRYEKKTYKSKVHQNGGSYPIWNHQFLIPI
jgi:Ca2+-dependent lipid-binding protein